MNEKLVIFIHLPKTAGTTIRNIIEKNYRTGEVSFFYSGYQDAARRLKMLSKPQLKSLKWIHGHFDFGLHEVIQRPAAYITMLRHPVDRVLSFYYFLRRNSRHPLHYKVKLMSLKEFVITQNNGIQNQVCNFQTYLLSGNGSPNLERAKKHIEEHFMLVGLTERFEESIFIMKKQLGWEVNHYTNLNVTQGRPKRETISQEIRKLIEKKNEIDLELYEYGKGVFQKQIESLS